MMITHYALHYKNRVLQIFLVIALALFCFAFAKNIKTIPDDISPLSSGNVEAMFYIENPETGTFTCVGDGLLKSIGEVVANEKVVSNAIISSPDYSNYMPTNTSIVWNTIKQVGAQYQVIGQLRQINSISIADYGAVGDGVTDNYYAIQTAIEAAISSAQTIEVPSGIYYVSKKLVIPGSIHIKGTGPSSSIIIFKDNPSNSDYASYLQRGIISFKGSGLTVENICFKYEAINYTPYTREAGQAGNAGVLFFLADVSNITFKNTEVTISGNYNPALTCVWAKSETTSMDNIKFESCDFKNFSECTVGGCLWISGHDNKNTTVSNAIVDKCTFTNCGRDEAYALWGYHVSNCSLLNSIFNYIGKTVYTQTIATFGSTSAEEYLSNIIVSGNTFNLTGEVRNAIGVQILSEDSSININNNYIYGDFQADKSFICFALTKCGNSIIYENTAEITGGNNISFISYDKGGIVDIDNNQFTITDCISWLMIQSKYSVDFYGGDVTISNSHFSVAPKSNTKGKPIIQYPISGKLVLQNTVIDTTKANVHEIVIQTLTKNSINGDYYNPIELIDITTDASIIFNVTTTLDRTIKLDHVQSSNLYYSFSNNSKLDEVQMNDCTYNNFYINYKKSTPQQLETYVNSVSIN